MAPQRQLRGRVDGKYLNGMFKKCNRFILQCELEFVESRYKSNNVKFKLQYISNCKRGRRRG